MPFPFDDLEFCKSWRILLRVKYCLFTDMNKHDYTHVYRYVYTNVYTYFYTHDYTHVYTNVDNNVMPIVRIICMPLYSSQRQLITDNFQVYNPYCRIFWELTIWARPDNRSGLYSSVGQSINCKTALPWLVREVNMAQILLGCASENLSHIHFCWEAILH